MADLVLEKKGFTRSCITLFFYGCKTQTLAWAASIFGAFSAVAFSAGAIIALTFAVINDLNVPASFMGYQLPLSYVEFFCFFSVTGIMAYALTFWFERYFSEMHMNSIQDNSSPNPKKTHRQRLLIRVLACRVKYLLAPYFFIFLIALIIALSQKQFAVLVLGLIPCVLIGLQGNVRLNNVTSLVFADRAMTPLRIGFSRLIVVFVIGGLLIAFHAHFNLYSLLVVMSFLALAVHLIRCRNLFNKIEDFLPYSNNSVEFLTDR